MTRLLWSLANLAALIGTLVVNALSTIIPLGGETPGQLSDKYPNLFVPAAITFSIWGLIYVLLAMYVFYGLYHSQRGNTSAESFVERIGTLFIVSSFANMGWIFAWQYQLVPLSLVVMLILLATLIALYHRIRPAGVKIRPIERFAVHVPFSIYLGWISVATIANVTAVLVASNWNRYGLSAGLWAVAMIAVACLLTLMMSFRHGDIFYALVIDWALVGIILKRTSAAVPNQAVILASSIGLGVVSVSIIVQIARGRVYRR